jgi:hypothetical protein
MKIESGSGSELSEELTLSAAVTFAKRMKRVHVRKKPCS